MTVAYGRSPRALTGDVHMPLTISMHVRVCIPARLHESFVLASTVKAYKPYSSVALTSSQDAQTCVCSCLLFDNLYRSHDHVATQPPQLARCCAPVDPAVLLCCRHLSRDTDSASSQPGNAVSGNGSLHRNSGGACSQSLQKQRSRQASAPPLNLLHLTNALVCVSPFEWFSFHAHRRRQRLLSQLSLACSAASCAEWTSHQRREGGPCAAKTLSTTFTVLQPTDRHQASRLKVVL